MGHWILLGKRWKRRYAAPRILTWPLDPRNHQVFGRARGRIVMLGEPRPAAELVSAAEAWPRVPFWDAVADLSARPDLQSRTAAARAKLAMQGVGLTDEHLAREIIGQLLGQGEIKPIWTLFDSLNPGDLDELIEAQGDRVLAGHLPPGWDLDRYHRQVAALAQQLPDRSGRADRPDRARRAGVTWADYWQASALLGLPIGPTGEAEHPERNPSDGLLICCALVWRAGFRGALEELDQACKAARIVACPALRRAVFAAWATFVELGPADRSELARLAHRPPERSKTSPPILRPGHLLHLAWEARKSRWLRRDPEYFQDACDRVDVRDDREMREAIGRNWRRLDPGFFRMPDPTLGPPPRPAYP